ncbi:MAG: hypothetical protein JSV31_21060 [Desulfobacterales bacterium]|nr:MAG: hypothetical protein JSV31_21060 [Desulfobacterales bacterium]
MNTHEKMDNEHPDEIKAENSETETDWENRTLCSDGNCIGVVGPDGRCKECGKKYEGPDFEGSHVEDDMREEEAEVEEEEEIIEEKETQDDLVWENRTLCSDGNCIGVIGPDGRCKECGKPDAG